MRIYREQLWPTCIVIISILKSFFTTTLTSTVQVTENTYTDESQEQPFAPPKGPPPTLQALDTNKHTRVSNHQYNRLRFPKAGRKNHRAQSKSDSESSAYYIIPEHDRDDDDGVEYYTEFDEENMENPYVDESQSLIYTDSQYSTESDLYSQQQKKLQYTQSIVRSSSLELQSDDEDTRARQAARAMNNTGQMPHSPHNYQNCVPKHKYGNTAPSARKVKNNVDIENDSRTTSTPYYQEIVATREFRTQYTAAEMLEESTVI